MVAIKASWGGVDYRWTGAPHWAQKAAPAVRADPQFTQYRVGGGVGEAGSASGGLDGPAAGGIAAYGAYGGLGPYPGYGGNGGFVTRPPSATMRISPTTRSGTPMQRNGKKTIPMMVRTAPIMSNKAPVVSCSVRFVPPLSASNASAR